MKTRLAAATMIAALAAGCSDETQPTAEKNVVIFVWDGLRPDSPNATDTPNLLALRGGGVDFQDNHSTYPTFTMMNSASFATGGFPGTTGFYGNTLWANGPATGGKSSSGGNVDLHQPIFTEDWGVLDSLRSFYSGNLLLVKTLFEAAHDKGLKTAAVGKSGAAYLQDYKRGGDIVDENFIWPESLAREVAASSPLPRNTQFAYDAGTFSTVTLPDGGPGPNPTAAGAVVRLADKVTADPTADAGSPNNNQNKYMMDVFTQVVLPKDKPRLTLVWFRSPDSTEHPYGPGTAQYRDSLRSQDALLGELMDGLRASGMDQSTDIIVVSDHGHTSVSGPLATFPLRSIAGGAADAIDPNGFSVSGDVRTADLIARVNLGFAAWDGNNCTDSPTLSGIKADGSEVYTSVVASGPCMGLTTGDFRLPATLGASDVVIAANGGSEYFYVPSGDATQVGTLVAFLQSREEFGAIFVASKYGNVPGTLPLTRIRVESNAQRTPDVVASFSWDDQAVVQGLKGIEFESMQRNRGMHGTFGTVDVHNSLFARGPDFKSGFADTLPSGNIDVAPTAARILALDLPGTDGRVLEEALAGGPAANAYSVVSDVVTSSPSVSMVMKLPTSPDGTDTDGNKTYTVELHVKNLTRGSESKTYFDYARAIRQ